MTRPARSRPYRFDPALRRSLDVAVAVVGLIILAPLMLVIAVAIRIETPGPVFFSQVRLGRGGGRFRIHKFRKFAHVAQVVGPAVTLKNDPRMTRVGRILERTKLDELPNLWNVLRGDMSMVGPRPEMLDFADCFQDGYQEVLNYTPGLFGPSQAIFRNESSCYLATCEPQEFYRTVLFPAKARIDLVYFSRRTVVSDIGWMIRGILVVVGISAFHRHGLSSVEAAEELLRRYRLMSADSVVGERN